MTMIEKVRHIMTSVIEKVLDEAKQIDPNSPAVEVASAVAQTVVDPSPANIIADIEMAITLVKHVKASLATMHPSVANIVKLLF